MIEYLDEVDLGLTPCGPVCIDGGFLLGRAAVGQVVGERHAVVGQHDVDLERLSFGEGALEIGGDPTRGSVVLLHEGEFAGATDGDEQVRLALLDAEFSDARRTSGSTSMCTKPIG